MLVSMTGYGRAEQKTEKGTVLIEIQSQNRKFLETVILNLPDSFFGFDIEIKKEVKKMINRGHVTIRLHFIKGELKASTPSLDVLQRLKTNWQKLSTDLGYDKDRVDLSFILERMKETATSEERSDKEKEEVLKVLQEALLSIIKMKKDEGRVIEKDLVERLEQIQAWLKQVKEMAKEQPSIYKEKLEKRVEEYFSKSDEDKERVAKEVVLFADRVDITEELVRLGSHIDQFKDLILSEETVLGKKLDFLCQEMFREANTIASKSYDVEITKVVVYIKGELEKIREQIQNVE